MSILITDDNQNNRVMLSQLLKSLLPEATLINAVSGEEAIAMVKNKISAEKSNFQLIFMDFQMPGINGEQTTGAIRELEKKISDENKSIIITWSSAKTMPYQGADDWMSKPADKQEMIAILVAYGFLTPLN